MSTISDEELLAYADEQLETELSAQVEKMLRREQSQRERLRNLLEQRDQGNLGVGDIWRHERLSCPKRSELGLFLLNALDSDHRNYITFHLQLVGCNYCLASLEEMQAASATEEIDQKAAKRRKQLFVTSAGLLRKSN